MKTSKKVLAIVLAIALAFALSAVAFAADIQKTAGVDGPASITVHIPEITDGRTANNTYKIYKVFDAALTTDNSGISYTLVNGKTTAPDGFQVDAQGNIKYVRSEDATNLTQTDINAIAAYVGESDLVATVNTTNADTEFTVTGLPYGYYYITTTTGTVVTVNSTKPNADVVDKNEIPPVDKLITGAHSIDEAGKKAIADVGSTVNYTATITKKAGAENYVFHDKMSAGLTYNNDAVVKVNGQTITAGATTFTMGSLDGDTLTITFKNSFINGLADDTEIVIEYSATVNSDALQIDPAKNTAYLNYGDETGENSTPIKETEVYNAKISVIKTDDENKPLAGAGFVLKNKEDGKFYTLVNNDIVWVDSIDAADEHMSDAEGNVPAFTGLCDGTYTLVEKTVPAGYNGAADVDITIAGRNFTAENLIQSATVVNKEGPALPSTGGIGTTIFYIVGSVLLLAAAIVLIARRRTAADVA